MKAIKLFFIFILISTSLYSQDILDPQPLWFEFNSSSFTYNINSDQFKQTEFIRGWQWGGIPKMSKALKMNMNHYKYTT